MVRRASTENFERIEHIRDRINIVQADLLDQLSLIELIEDVKPDEVYNFAAQSFVPTSWIQPALTGEFTALGVTKVLEAIKLVDRKIKFYQASSSEMFGKVVESPQNEKTPFHPRSPYGVAKAYGHFITVNYRESYDMFTVSGILFNHESPAARPGIRDAQDFGWRGAHQAGHGKGAATRQSQCAARLGIRRRLRGSYLDDACSGSTPRILSLRPARRTRCETLPGLPSTMPGSTGRSMSRLIPR